MPKLLVVPARQESGEDRVHAGARHQKVRQVERNVVLDVHHVVQAEKVALRQGMRGDFAPRDPGDVDLLRLFLVALDAEAHINPYEIRARTDHQVLAKSQPPHTAR